MSLIYRKITFIAFLLLAISFLLVVEAASQSSAKKTKKSRDADYKDSTKLEYERLKIARGTYREHLKINLIDLEKSAKCPFRVLYLKGFIRVMCDLPYCSAQQYDWCGDCQQAYMKAKDIRPKANASRWQADVEAGCVYNPKQGNHSIETNGPAKTTRFV
jgi:hypothetical protein